MLSLLYLLVKAPQYFVTSSCLFSDEKTLLEIWLNPGINLIIFPGTGPRAQADQSSTTRFLAIHFEFAYYPFFLIHLELKQQIRSYAPVVSS